VMLQGSCSYVQQEAEFRATEKAIYKITKDGIRAARWDQGWLKSSSGASASQHSLDTAHDSLSPNNARPRRSNSIDESSGSAMTAVTPSGLSRKPSMKERPNFDFSDTIDKDVRSKDSHTARLKHILDEPSLRSLFREFLRVNFCEENLSFWVDMQDFKRRFNTTSSAIATPGMGKTQRTAGQQVMEKHQQDLIAMAFVIYNSKHHRFEARMVLTCPAYLAPHSLCELNIDHSLRNELISYMTQISSENEVAAKGHIEPETGSTLHASQLQTTVKLYERIQTYIFRLIATDSVPKVGDHLYIAQLPLTCIPNSSARPREYAQSSTSAKLFLMPLPSVPRLHALRYGRKILGQRHFRPPSATRGTFGGRW